MKYIAATTLFVTLVLAKSALIPIGISNTCSDYLSKLDADTSLSGCTTSIISATSAFAPSLNGSTNATTPSTADVKSALASLCANTACSLSVLRSTIGEFYQSCTDELIKNSNKDIIALYDTVYNLSPYRSALCTKEESGEYCPISVGKITSLPSGLAEDLATPVPATSGSDSQVVQAVKVNADTLVNNNLLFLGLSSSLSSDKLCTSCTRNVLTAFIAFQATSPYAPGLSNSVFLAKQSEFYQAVTKTCGEDFLTKGDGVAAAAGIAGGVLGGDDGEDNGAAHAFANTGAATWAAGTLAILLSAAL